MHVYLLFVQFYYTASCKTLFAFWLTNKQNTFQQNRKKNYNNFIKIFLPLNFVQYQINCKKYQYNHQYHKWPHYVYNFRWSAQGLCNYVSIEIQLKF